MVVLEGEEGSTGESAGLWARSEKADVGSWLGARLGREVETL